MASTPTTLHDDLAAIVSQIPPTIEARITAGIERVTAGGPYGTEIGAIAPDFELPDTDSTEVSLASLLAAEPVVISFYRGDWCPFCNLELRALHASLPEIRALGASVVAISPQAPDRAMALRAKHELGFAVLSDVDQSVISAYGLLYSIDEDSRDLFENTFRNDIAGHNADGTWRLPIPATFVVDTHGAVRDRFVSTEYRTRMEPASIVETLRQLAGERG